VLIYCRVNFSPHHSISFSQHRVRPGPDPDRPENETKWMSTQQLEDEALKPSTNWVQASSGDLGKLYLELIGCDNLPRMDGPNPKDKTDAFACIVYQDSIVNTDVISNSLSPRWMPWCNRAFVFNISHPSSDILIGMFDHDAELSPLQLVARATSTVHDPIGRLVINTENFVPGTEYTLKVSSCRTSLKSTAL
jgi:C2 domain